jgi:hypothetical protein
MSEDLLKRYFTPVVNLSERVSQLENFTQQVENNENVFVLVISLLSYYAVVGEQTSGCSTS